jgi:hypothetical protein
MTTQPMLFPLIPPAKIENPAYDVTSHRHGGNTESVKAHRMTEKARMRNRVYDFALRCGEYGITTDEIADMFCSTPNAISGRLTELKALGLLVRTDRCRPTRSGCSARVFKAVRN